MPKKLVTIAGSDALGGGGLQADLATFTEAGFFGLSVITSIVTITPADFQIFPTDEAILAAQLESTLAADDIAGIKVGLLPNLAALRLVVDALQPFVNRVPIIVDPVMVFKETDQRADQLVTAFKEALLPLATLLTPNLAEASLLTGQTITNQAEMAAAAQKLQQLGAANVVIKGGNRLDGALAQDVLLADDALTLLTLPKVGTAQINGAGCTFAAALTSQLAQQNSLLASTVAAKSFVHAGIVHAVSGNVWQSAARLQPINEAVKMEKLS